jgi:phosphoribosylaminoimidazolecarboxamide formyltransferase / IMP cyclohydrolase
MDDFKRQYRKVMDDHFPDELTISFGSQVLSYRKRSWKIPDSSGALVEKGLRYGENPGQEAALYELVSGNLELAGCKFIGPGSSLVSGITEENMVQAGKHPGKTNLTDVDNALNILKFLMKLPACAIMKHNNPSGVSQRDSLSEAYHSANMADRIAAFGGAAVFNRSIDMETAELLAENYLEVVAAPDYESGVVDVLTRRKNLRILSIPGIQNLENYRLRRFIDFKSLMDGGIVIQQSAINSVSSSTDLKPAEVIFKGTRYFIERKPTTLEITDMIFGWAVEQGVTSNSVLYVKDGCTVGIGTGEQDRVGVAELAVIKAQTKYRDRICFERYGKPFNEQEDPDIRAELDHDMRKSGAGLIGSVMVSDAFFPFRDGVDVGIRAGVCAIVQPGGSDRDYESIQACNEASPQVTMMYTGQRAFKH